MIDVATPQPDQAAILEALAVLFDPADVIEVRAFPKGRKRTFSGYFDSAHWPDLANHAARLSADGAAVYITLNPVDQQLLGRYSNRIEPYATATTTDKQVTRRRWLLIDLDPVRPSDTSATVAQLEAAHGKAVAIYKHLEGLGWPAPQVAISGNGYHLLYAIDLPNDDDTTALLKGVLQALGDRFDDANTKVDRSVFNAGRICKLYGTVANKGDNTTAAPWRLSTLVKTPERVLVTVDQLRSLQPPAPSALKPPTRSAPQGTFTLEDFLARHHLECDSDMHDGRERFKLKACPFNPEHINGEAAIFRDAEGKLGFRCMHDSCGGNNWQSVRDLLDKPRQQRAQQWDYDAFQLAAGAGESGYIGQCEAQLFLKDKVVLTCGADLTPSPVRWLWRNWMALGKLHIMAGAPGQGKTTIAIAFAATITQGGRWPDGSICAPGNVLIWSGEDDPADTLLPRLLAAGANPNNCYFVSGTRIDGEVQSFDPARDMAALEAEANKIGGVKLLIVDPVVSVVAGDTHKNGEVRRALQPLVDLASRLDAAVLGISHFSKGGQGSDPALRVVGSIAFTAVARVVLVAAKVKSEDGEDRRILARGKSNIGPDDGGFEYHIEQSEPLPGIHASYIAWGKSVEGNARDLLTDPEGADGENETNSAVDAAERFLMQVLADGITPVKTIEAEAKNAGVSWAAVRRAAVRMMVIKTKGAGGWYWKLVNMLKQDAQDVQRQKVEHLEHLEQVDGDGSVFLEPQDPPVILVDRLLGNSKITGDGLEQFQDAQGAQHLKVEQVEQVTEQVETLALMDALSDEEDSEVF